jgi:hypothetical protein
MFDKLISEVQNAVKGEEVVIGDEVFSTRPVFRPEPLRQSDTLFTSSLQSIVDYLDRAIDAPGPKMFVHVNSPSLVELCLYLDNVNRRDRRVSALYEAHNFRFGEPYDQSSFITLLRSAFVQTESREQLQRFVGSLTDESSLKLEDDGVSQKTVAKTGITTLSVVENNKPIELAPFRTFPEIEQPESEFIVRLHRREGDVPRISLHEADNHAWKIEAIQRISEWLTKNGVNVPILA